MAVTLIVVTVYGKTQHPFVIMLENYDSFNTEHFAFPAHLGRMVVALLVFCLLNFLMIVGALGLSLLFIKQLISVRNLSSTQQLNASTIFMHFGTNVLSFLTISYFLLIILKFINGDCNSRFQTWVNLPWNFLLIGVT